MTATIKGSSAIIWGTTGLASYSGIIVSVKDQSTAEMVEIPDTQGFAATVVFFNHKHECEVTMVAQASMPNISIGDTVTIAGIAGCIVTDCTKDWEQKKNAGYTVKATKWANI